ncbi:hypothetical protein [Candidatus Methylomirabilis sp.]|uniref:hypothetical protein n=1 Tax=Candidatus Methylomirabilis sp. TaxID=2032687 RepID=UPI0030767B90
MADIDAVIEHRSQYAVEVLSRYTPVAAAYLFGSHFISSPLVRCTNPTSPVSPRISWRMVYLSNRKVQSVSSHAGDRV